MANITNMKKILLSLFVIVTFVVYSLQQRREGLGTTVTIPTQLTKSSQSNSSNGSTTQTASNSPSQQTITYKDGQFTGDAADAYYGYIQVKVTISGGKISDVVFLQYPNDRENSVFINQQAMPYLKQEAIQAQNSKVDIVSGATDTSMAFIQSLSSALTKAV